MSGSAPAGTTLDGLAIATMFRGEPTQLVQWCNFHINAGVERLYVALDRPTDELLRALPEDPRVHWEPFAEATWDRLYAPSGANVERRQVDAMRWLARRAEAEGHQHLAFIDTDELLDLAVPFDEIITQHPGAAAVTVPVREMWFEEGAAKDGPFGATLALRRSPRGIDWTRALGWRAQYLRNGLLGHDIGKTIYRLPLISGELSVHGPLTAGLRSRWALLPDGVGRLLHFDCGTVATWNAKWAARLTGSTVATGLGSHRQAQQRLFEHALRRSPAEQQRFFEGFFSLAPDAVDMLEAEGLLERVDLAPMLAGPLPESPLSGSRGLVQLPTPYQRTDFQFAMVCDNNFVSPTYATMISVLSQMDPDRSIRFVVLGDGLGKAEERHLRSLEHIGLKVEVLIHDITADLDRDLGAEGHKRSRATYGRVYLVDLLPEQRTVYLDGDVLATREVTELFDLDLGDACIAGVPDSAALRAVADPAGVPIDQRMRLAGVAGEDPLEYLNAGVLVLDLDHPDFRELALRSRGYVARAGRALVQHDQDAINLAFRGRKYRLPNTYNYMTQFYTSDRCLDGSLVSLKYSAADASLIHFSGKIKPWVASEEEFYNGLYRRIVLTAEERLGVSCGFYFSRRFAPGGREWSSHRWARSLAPGHPLATTEVSPRSSDIELVDITDSALYVRLSPEAYEHAVGAGLQLVARSAHKELFRLRMGELSPPQTHLGERVMPGVRVATIDLTSSLAAESGVARHVEVVLTRADAVPDGFHRSMGVIDVLAAGTAAVPALVDDLGVEGAIAELSDGLLKGWYRVKGEAPVSLHIGDELVARRTPSPGKDRIRPIKFRVAHLVSLGYGNDGEELTVRVAGTNVPLPGLRVTVDDVVRQQAAGQTQTAPLTVALSARGLRAALVRTRKRLSPGRAAR